eukprot:scaffold4229_cov67-Phaeocystis_antarctica.AAC.2
MPAFWAARRCRALGLLEHVAHQPGGVGGEDEHVAEQAYELQAHDRLDGRVARLARHDQLRDGDDHDERRATQPGPELEPPHPPKVGGPQPVLRREDSGDADVVPLEPPPLHGRVVCLAAAAGATLVAVVVAIGDEYIR